jgi:serine/threonine protein kinase
MEKDISEEAAFFGNNANGGYKHYSQELRDLVRALIVRDPEARLGSKGDAKEILAHPAFDAALIESVNKREFKPKVIPDEKTVLDLTQDFNDVKFKTEISERLFYPDRDLIKENASKFEGFKKYIK